MAHSSFQPLFILGLILVAGYCAGKVANYLKLPRISGYIINGLIFSPSINGLVSYQQIDTLFNFTSELSPFIPWISPACFGVMNIER